MNGSSRLKWIWAVLFVGALYLVAGLASSALVRSSATNDMRVAWRLAAWVISAVAFASHIVHESVRLRSTIAATALHASLAVGLGAFALAVAASLHGRAVHQHFPTFALAVWPVMTALPAFFVALAAAAVLSRMRRSTPP